MFFFSSLNTKRAHICWHLKVCLIWRRWFEAKLKKQNKTADRYMIKLCSSTKNNLLPVFVLFWRAVLECNVNDWQVKLSCCGSSSAGAAGLVELVSPGSLGCWQAGATALGSLCLEKWLLAAASEPFVISSAWLRSKTPPSSSSVPPSPPDAFSFVRVPLVGANQVGGIASKKSGWQMWMWHPR